MNHPRRSTLACRRPLAALAAALGLLLVSGCMSTAELREEGIKAYQAGQFESAGDYFEQVLERRPNDWRANYYLGRLALRDNNPDRARMYLEVAYTLRDAGPPEHPETPRIVDALAESLYRQGQHRRLVGFLDEAVDRYGRLHDYLRKAEYLDRLNDRDAAMQAYRTAAKVYPQRVEAHLALADFYEKIGDEEQALLALRRAYTLDPQNQAIADRIRGYGVVPGPTIYLRPED